MWCTVFAGACVSALILQFGYEWLRWFAEYVLLLWHVYPTGVSSFVDSSVVVVGYLQQSGDYAQVQLRAVFANSKVGFKVFAPFFGFVPALLCPGCVRSPVAIEGRR